MGWPFPDNDDHLQAPPRYVCGLHDWADDDWPCDFCLSKGTLMPIIASASSKDFTPAPAGAHAAVCCDVVDLGLQTSEYQGQKKTQHKIRIVWQLADELTESGQRFTVNRRYTLSLDEKAALRKDLESWRGRAFTKAELAGFDVETVLGAPCYLSVTHKQQPDGKTYANVQSVMALPKGMPKPTVSADYVRHKDRPGAGEPPQDAQQFGAVLEQAVTDALTDADIPF